MILPTGRGIRSIRGFTLIELAIVTVIVLVLVAISTPSFRATFASLELDNTAQDLAKVMIYAQEMSVIDKVNYKICLEPGSHIYWLAKQSPYSGKGKVFDRFAGRFGRTFAVPERIGLRANTAEIVFYPDGHSDEQRIEMNNSLGEKRTITVAGIGNIIVTGGE